jgi:S1-C subfamily serine protease
MITFNVLHRVFFIKAQSYGTAFTLDKEGKQYLVTARHVFGDDKTRSAIEILYKEKWETLSVKIIELGVGDADIAVLVPSIRLSPALALDASLDGISLGQDVFFAGFPLKMWSDGGEVMRGRPLAFIKKGTLSALERRDGVHTIWVDAINNEGFSGGPLLFRTGTSDAFKIAGVVNKFRTSYENVFDREGNRTDSYVEYNAGFLGAVDIKHVTDIIEKRPCGLPI